MYEGLQVGSKRIASFIIAVLLAVASRAAAYGAVAEFWGNEGSPEALQFLAQAHPSMEFLLRQAPHLGAPRSPSPAPVQAPESQAKSASGAGIVRLVCKGTLRILAFGNGYSENNTSAFEVVLEIDLTKRTLKADGFTYKDTEISDTFVAARYPDREIEAITVNRITGGPSGWLKARLAPILSP
ncbi:hypothetical protein [Bradyrhizobium sp. LA6.12]|uniref:hypothetical protein n=1 Tax=unclassified Bradyrhizobium TaxID=2631580 RepID=UPI00339ACA88